MVAWEFLPRLIGASMVRITTPTLMAVLGGLTGLISATIPETALGVLQPLSALVFLDGSSVHPGLLFGLVVGAGVWWSGERRAWLIGLVFLITVLAWSAAMNTALWVYDFKHERALIGMTVPGSSTGEATAVMKFLTGFIAGIAGAAVMTIGCAFFVPSLRGIVPVGTTILVGGLAGLLLYPFLQGWNETLALLVLFSTWQASVGAALGRGLSPARDEPDKL